MPSLGFALLDQHVVAGHADEMAVHDGASSLTFARLLEQTAAVAGGLKALGLQAGDPLRLDVPAGADRVVVVCACLRLGVLPGDAGPSSVADQDGTVVVTVDGQEPIDLATLRRAGASDPAVALPGDAEGFRAAAEITHPDVVAPLLLGRSISVD